MGCAAEIWQEDVTEGETCVRVMWETGRRSTLEGTPVLRAAAAQSGGKKGQVSVCGGRRQSGLIIADEESPQPSASDEKWETLNK